jgi:hypothetical protein
MAALQTHWMTAVSVEHETLPRPGAAITEKITLRLLGDGGGHLVSGTVIQLIGQRLFVQVSEHLKPATCVRIDCKDAFVLGEVLGCWREQSATFAVVKLLQELSGLEELAEVCGEPMALPEPLKAKVLKRA